MGICAFQFGVIRGRVFGPYTPAEFMALVERWLAREGLPRVNWPVASLPSTAAKAISPRRKSGSPKGVPVNGKAFKAFRGFHTQEKLANVDVSPTTIQRAEAGRRIGRGDLEKILQRANKARKNNRKTIEELTSV